MFEDFLKFMNETIIGPIDKYPLAAVLVFVSLFVIFLAVAVEQNKTPNASFKAIPCQCVHSKQVLPEMP